MVLFWFEAQHKGKPRCIFNPAAFEYDQILRHSQTQANQTLAGRNAYPHRHFSEAEGIIVFIVIPSIGSFKPNQTINGTAGIGSEGKPQLQRILIKDSEELAGILLIRIDLGSEFHIPGNHDAQ